jgi:hypothetical protein
MRIFFFTLLLIAAQITQAQNKFSFGPRIGTNVIPFTNEDPYGKTYKMSFNGGGVMRYHWGEHFSLRTELYYTGKKKQYSFEETSRLLNSLGGLASSFIDTNLVGGVLNFINDTVYSHYKGTSTGHFIELPLMASFHYKNLEIGAGITFAYLVGAKVTEELNQESALLDLVYPFIDSIQFVGPFIKGIIDNTFPGYSKPSVYQLNEYSFLKQFDMGMIADVSYHTSERLFFNFRYTRSFTNYRVTPLKDKDYYSAFTFGIGFSFGLSPSKGLKGIYDLDKVSPEKK